MPRAARQRSSHFDATVASMIDDLRARGLRMTRQRIAIVRQFAGDESHPTAQDLFERLRPSFPAMSFATVYNTLDALAKAGLSRTLRLGTAARFDPNTTPHHHAVCDRCGLIVDVPARDGGTTNGGRRALAEAAPGFAVHHVEHLYRGRCAHCN